MKSICLSILAAFSTVTATYYPMAPIMEVPQTVQYVAAATPAVKSHPVSKTDPIYFCPDNYSLVNGDRCEQVLTNDVQFVCPSGYELIDGGCVRRASMLNLCPAGYVKNANGCHRVIQEEAIHYCPEGTVEAAEGRGCERFVSVELVPQCSSGQQFDGSVCTYQSTVTPIAYCPDGYTASTVHAHLQLCEKIITYDCTHGLQRQRRLTMLFDQPHHPITTHLEIQKTCTKTDAVHMLYRCPSGSSPSIDGHHCIQVQTVQPNYVCPARSDGGDCHRVEAVGIVSECPPGTTQRCTEQAQALGSYGGGHHTGYGHGLYGTGLGAVRTQQCVCERIEPAAFTQACPESFEPVEGGGCQQACQPKVVCQGGYTLQGDTCVRTVTIPASCEFTVTYRCEGGCVVNP